MTLKLAVIGVGHWHAARHLDAFRRAGASVLGVHDGLRDVADRSAHALGVPAYASHHDLLDAGPDLVLAMPRHRDAPALLADLVRRNVPFVVEKPAATAAPDLLPHVLAVEAQNQFAAVPLINRYSAFWTEVGRQREDGLLRPVSAARFRIVNGPPSRYLDDGVGWVLDPAVAGGGALRNLGTHTVDAYLSLAAGTVEVVGGALTSRQHGLPVEEHAAAILRDGAGLIGIVEVGYSRPDDDGTDHEWCVAGRGAYVTELHDTVHIVTARQHLTVPSPTVLERYRLFAADVVDRLRRGEPTPVPLRDCWRSLDVIDRIYAHALSRTGAHP